MDEKNLNKAILKNNGELNAAFREQSYIAKASLALDELEMGFDSANRLKQIHAFLETLALIEDFEMANDFPADLEELNKLATRAMSFVLRESKTPNIDQQFAEDICSFVKEFKDFVYQIKVVSDGNFRERLESKKTGKQPLKFVLQPRKFQDVPTAKYFTQTVPGGIEIGTQQQTQVTLEPLTEAEKQRTLLRISEQPILFLKLETKYFVDREFIEQAKQTAIDHFPRYCKDYYRRKGYSCRKAFIDFSTQKFVKELDWKIEKKSKEISSIRGGDGK